jgi:murein DD-endopeptidase MepM/ murein hydrolase activator NlpD
MAHLRGVLLVSALVLLQSGSGPVLRVTPVAAPAAAPAPKPQRAKAPPAPPAGPSPADHLLASRRLAVPVEGIPKSKLRDTFHEKRGTSRTHKAIDIMAPWGTPVLAADTGKIAKISSNRAGGLAVYQVDSSGRFVYYYAHLAGYADDLREGQQVQRGELIGYVGATGNAPASAPHLHFAVQLVTVEGRLWKGEPLNPYGALMAGVEMAQPRDDVATGSNPAPDTDGTRGR